MSLQREPWIINDGAGAIGAAEGQAVLDVLRRGYARLGPETEALEAEFASLVGASHAVALSSRAAAVHLALLCIDVGPRDEVIQSAINHPAAANMTVAVGAEPAFADVVSADCPVVDVERIDRAWTSRVAAVIATPFGGMPCDLEAVHTYCRAQDLLLIEDVSYGLGAMWGGRAIGTWGDVGCFSCGAGGMLVTDHDDLAARARQYRCHGIAEAESFDIVANGFDYCMDELRAVQARVALACLHADHVSRRERVVAYQTALADVPGVAIVGGEAMARGACCLMAVTMEPIRRNAARKACDAAGVATGWHYPCLPGCSAFGGTTALRHVPASKAFAEREITLPLHPSLAPEAIVRVCEIIRTRETAGVV